MQWKVPWEGAGALLSLALALSGLVMACLAFWVVWDMRARLAHPEEDAWIVIPVMERSTCVMDATDDHVRGRLVVVSVHRLGGCTIAAPGLYPKQRMVGIMLDDTVVAGQEATILHPKH